MQDNEAIIKLIVALDGSSNLVPTFRIDAAAVEQVVEFQDTVSDLPTVGAGRSTQTLHSFASAFLIGHNLEGFRV